MIFSKQSQKHKGRSFVLVGDCFTFSSFIFLLENVRNAATFLFRPHYRYRGLPPKQTQYSNNKYKYS
jgi:hypothetical protein